MDPRGPRIRRKGGHSALPRKIQHRALDDSGVVDVRERGNRQRRLEIRETSGQLRTVMLSRLKVNAGAPGREFMFSPPSGVQVVDSDSP